MPLSRFLPILSLLVAASCSDRKVSLAIDEDLAPAEFVSSFPELTLPWSLTEEALSPKPSDSVLVNPALVRRFVPDSVYRKEFRKSERPKFHAIGRISVKDGESYLLLRASTPTRTAAYVLCFDELDSFRVSMPVMRLPAEPRYRTEFSVDRRHVMSKVRTRTSRAGQALYRKDAWVYNSAGVFTLVMTESNEPIEEDEVYNPIDTFPSTRPLSGDYRLSSRDFVSIRDGRSDKRMLFFLHMERRDGDCTGELRGEIDMVAPGIAHYNRADDHCMLEFAFRGNTVTVRELSACGNRRSVRCTFSGTYRRKPPASRKRR
jgi:hypothetical protein